MDINNDNKKDENIDKYNFAKKINPKIWVPILAVVFISGVILTLTWNGSINLRVSSRQDSSAASGKCGDGVCGPVEKDNPNLCPRDCKNISLKEVFIVLHMEDGENNSYPSENFPRLDSLVNEADKYDIKLTLEFNPSWADFFLSHPSQLQRLRGWEVNGHEIALHHHGPSHPDWNGYTNDQNYMNDPAYKGSVKDMIDIIKQLPSNGRILTGGIGPTQDEIIDWPFGIIFGTDGGRSHSDLLSVPTQVSYRGLNATQLKHRVYTNNSGIQLSEIEKGYYDASPNEIMGIIFHAYNYDINDSKAMIDDLFRSLNRNNIKARTVKNILSKYLNDASN